MKLLILLFMLFNSPQVEAYKLTDDQEYVRLIAMQVGKNNCVDICFTNTLQAIAWQESSFGRTIIGDAKGKYYYYMHMGKEIFISKYDTFFKDGARYTWYKPNKQKYIKKVYSRTGWKPLAQSSLGAFQIQIPTAKRVIRERKLVRYYSYLSNEDALVNALLKNPHFGATIAVNYLIMNYEWAKGKYKSPWKLAVSRYNGGNNNTKYIRAITSKIKRLNQWQN